MLMLLFFVENQRSEGKGVSCFFENKFVALWLFLKSQIPQSEVKKVRIAWDEEN
jgi:hypothetical protein